MHAPVQRKAVDASREPRSARTMHSAHYSRRRPPGTRWRRRGDQRIGPTPTAGRPDIYSQQGGFRRRGNEKSYQQRELDSPQRERSGLPGPTLTRVQPSQNSKRRPTHFRSGHFHADGKLLSETPMPTSVPAPLEGAVIEIGRPIASKVESVVAASFPTSFPESYFPASPVV